MSATRRTLAASLALVLASCGAKTALDVSAIDAAVATDAFVPLDSGDAGAFRTFPCRWFPEPAIPLPLGILTTAAASAELERVAVVGRDFETSPLTWLSYVPRATPVLEGGFELRALTFDLLVPRRGGWLAGTFYEGMRACELTWLDRSREIERTVAFDGAASGCELRAVDLDHAVLGIETGFDELSLAVLDTASGDVREVAARVAWNSAATRARDGSDFVVAPVGPEWEARALTPEGGERVTRWERPRASSVQLAPDRLLGGAVVLVASEDTTQLDRLRVDGDVLVREPIATLDARVLMLDLATNETEALFSLGDGSFVAVPLHSGDVRRFAPPPGVVRGARLVVAPGASVAVQTWTDERGAPWMRALTCNR